MSNKLYIGDEARQKLFDGIKIVYNSTAHTLGANGRNSVYNKYSRVPIITNDGVSIARENEPEDLGELQGANLIKQVSEATNDEAGDGTTTSIILAYSMIEQGMKILSDPEKKINPMKLRKEMKDAADKVLAALNESAIKVSSLKELEHVATISVEDPEIGKTIAKAIHEAGDNGIVYVNDSEKVGVSIEKVDGYRLPQGMITPYLITNPEKMETILEEPAIIITDIQVQLNQDFINLIQEIVKNTKDILLICDEFHPDVLKFAVANLAKGNFKMSIIKKPMQSEYLEDIAALVGAYAMTGDKGVIKYSLEYLGSAKKVIINQKNTTIIGGHATHTTMKEYVDNLKELLSSSEDEILKTKLQERIARLTGGVYMLNVGEKTEAEAKYLRLKVDDAVNATKAAKEEGIVAGGGMALLQVFDSDISNITQGEAIIRIGCAAPIMQIIKNSGFDYYDFRTELHQNNECGFDAKEMKVVPNMIEAGIIDPVKVTRTAFNNAASFAGLFLTIESLITPLPEKNEFK